jgi:hypothetical protein
MMKRAPSKAAQHMVESITAYVNPEHLPRLTWL